jgi:hypothetical protein
MSKSYRIRTQVGVDKYINLNLEQDWEQLEILSLKILGNDVYTRFCADYGVVVGRVFVNGGYGLPNAKVSVFIPLDDADSLNPFIAELYPFKTIGDTTEEGYRYNLLPKLPSYRGHQSTGSFPNKGDVLMDSSYIEVFDKYYRFTVKTNESGDFMIMGVPVGNQTIVMDIDLSDMGCFSLSPQDLIQQGLATESQVDGATFKTSTNLRELPQIKNLVFDVDVRPFWGEADLCQVGITRVDFDLTKQANINIQPTSIFMGSIISTTDDDALKVSCKPKNNTGNLCELVAGPGEVLAIRQTINSDSLGLPILEQYSFEGGSKIIDADGTFVANVPMNLDYIYTNEFGEQAFSTDPKKGIPTKGKYRFKFKWQNEQGLQGSFLRANFLVPNIKEHGWVSSNTDPLNQSTTTYSYPTLPVGTTSGNTIVFGSTIGLVPLTTNNVASYQIYINGQIYLGTIESITVPAGQTFQIVATPIDPLQPQTLTFTQYPQALFSLLRSYAFSLDWDDYYDPQEAINCEDTFYEFKYNKVYTTAMFLDRYKNGIGRARHLGIKEIDNRTCKSNVNTFPVNDIIRNFDFIFFVFNILINILTFPILTLLFVAHLIAFMWPILKYLLIVLGIFLTYDAVVSGLEAIQTGLAAINDALGVLSVGLGVVVNAGLLAETIRNLLWGIAQIAIAAFKIALAAAFTAFAVLAAIKVKGFPRIGLPMISYPDCTSCDCDCGNAELDDDFDTNSVQQSIDAAAQSTSSGAYNLTLVPANSVIAPVNSAGSYNIDHPNLIWTTVNGDPDDDPFDCGPGFNGNFKSFATIIGDQDLAVEIAVRATLDFKRVISGYDVLSSTDPNRYTNDESLLLHAPQPFLWAADKELGDNTPDRRFFAYPLTDTFPQKLNEFNLRNKYFTGVNRIQTTVNPQIPGSQPFLDQVVVILMKQGTTSQLGIGGLCSFQDPNYTDVGSSNRLINLTGATLNQFGTNSITGTTVTGSSIPIVIQYANPADPNGNSNFPGGATVMINQPPSSQLPVPGNPNVEQSYLKYATDVEYFQLITGMTVSQFSGSSVTTPGYYESSYLFHDVQVAVPDCDVLLPIPINNSYIYTVPDVIKTMSNHDTYEVCIFVRGVDPNTVPQTIKYDLARIFGQTSAFGSALNISVTGQYYMNQPIKGTSAGKATLSHNTGTNTSANLYFPSFTFTPDGNAYSGFTSNLPYFYLATDDNTPGSNTAPYTPILGWETISQITQGGNLYQLLGGSNFTLPRQQTDYIGGGTFAAWDLNIPFNMTLHTNDNGSSPSCDQDCQIGQYYNYLSGWFNGGNVHGNLSAAYSPAYYRYGLPAINFNNPVNMVMRSDRLPTSTAVEDGTQTQTGYALHQNNNFAVYAASGALDSPTISAGGDLPSGESSDQDPITSGLTSTLSCEGMVPLECYTGSGSNVGVVPSGQCSIPANRMINGCYCLLNKTYLAQFDDDARLFLEWKVRFTMNFAACRGVFAQVFQNNWVNGVLYMFNFNKQTSYGLTANNPTYNYCDDVIVYNDISNNFYYRSSPWNDVTDKFIGKNSPTITSLLPSLSVFPGYGYNVKQIQFPTTVVDLGPRDSFINEICCGGNFGSYYADQLKSTSYQDNSDIVQLGFLSRILNDGVRQRMIPISVGGNNSEGKGIEQFFNSTRGAYRIDGDWAQMLSINSEWEVLPFITENLPQPNPNDYIYFGDNGAANASDIKPVMGLFFQTPDNDLRYRKIASPGIETFSFTPLIEENFGYPKSQVVPSYKWSIKPSAPTNGSAQNIFGTEDNNWYTDTAGADYNGGFFKKQYQSLNFTSSNEKYKTQTTELGFIANYDINGIPQPQPGGGIVLDGKDSGLPDDAVVVGGPYHFYFGLNNGKTAINRFYKLYVQTPQE